MKPKKRVLDPGTAAALEAIDREEAFKGQPAIIANKLPKDHKGLERRLDHLFEHLARNSADPIKSAFARARIEQVGLAIERFARRRVSLREWLAFIVAAGSLATAILAIAFRSR